MANRLLKWLYIRANTLCKTSTHTQNPWSAVNPKNTSTILRNVLNEKGNTCAQHTHTHIYAHTHPLTRTHGLHGNKRESGPSHSLLWTDRGGWESERKNERDAKYRERTAEPEIKQRKSAKHHFTRNIAWNQAQFLLQTVSQFSVCVYLVSPTRTQSQTLPWHPTAETVGNTALHHSTNVYSIQETPSCVHWILITMIWLASTDVFSSKTVSHTSLGCSYEVS